jgi:hypothetical protein
MSRWRDQVMKPPISRRSQVLTLVAFRLRGKQAPIKLGPALFAAQDFIAMR